MPMQRPMQMPVPMLWSEMPNAMLIRTVVQAVRTHRSRLSMAASYAIVPFTMAAYVSSGIMGEPI